MMASGAVLLLCSFAVVFGDYQSPNQPDGNDYIHHCNPIVNVHLNTGGNGSPLQTISHYGTGCSNQDLPKDCTDVKERGDLASGQYIVSPQDDGPPFRVYCDMYTDGGGWTVFQRREDGSIDFYLDWEDYKAGFGNVNSEHWLGNDNIHRLTAQGRYELRIDMNTFDGNTSYARYSTFRLGNSGTNYKLLLGSYSGNAGDSLSGHRNHGFTTRDRDNDANDGGNCATSYKGGWWYTSCHSSNLNGLYLNGPHESYANGVNWRVWTGYHYSLKWVEMKMRMLT